MPKLILTFSLALLLAACATLRQTPVNTDLNHYKRVDYLNNHDQVSFKVTGTFEDFSMDGVLIVKKLGESDFEVSLLSAGMFRVLKAMVTEEGIAWQYLFKDVDNALVRGRITQLLDLLLMPKTCRKIGVKNGEAMVTCAGVRAKERFYYANNEEFPVRAQTITALNTADLAYADYVPADADGGPLPHHLTYKDGKITLYLTLISLSQPARAK